MAVASGRRRNWIGWALAASLVLNLLFVGFLAGLAFRDERGRGRGGDPGLVAYARALPDEHRRALMGAIRGSEGAWREQRQAMAAALAEIRAALAAEPFVAERVEAALARQRTAQEALADRAAALLLERIERMSPEERAEFAERLGRERKKGDRRNRGRRDRDGRDGDWRDRDDRDRDGRDGDR